MLTDYEKTAYGLDSESNSDSDYLSRSEYASIRRTLEGEHWRHMLHNKYVSARFFSGSGLSMPKTLGYFDRDFGRSSNGRRLRSADELLEWAVKHCPGSFYLKHIGGGSGRSVLAVRRTSGEGLETMDGGFYSKAAIEDLLLVEEGGLTGYIVQEALKSHRFLRGLCGDARSSFRVNTLRNRVGGAQVQFAICRLGRPDQMQDNINDGGVYCLVDHSGIIKNAVTLVGKTTTQVDRHPATGQLLVGRKVPKFGLVKAEACLAATKTPGVKAVGWDIVLTNRRAYMIEGNVGWNIVLKQQITGGWKRIGVTDAWQREWGVSVSAD